MKLRKKIKLHRRLKDYLESALTKNKVSIMPTGYYWECSIWWAFFAYKDLIPKYFAS